MELGPTLGFPPALLACGRVLAVPGSQARGPPSLEDSLVPPEPQSTRSMSENTLKGMRRLDLSRIRRALYWWCDEPGKSLGPSMFSAIECSEVVD